MKASAEDIDNIEDILKHCHPEAALGRALWLYNEAGLDQAVEKAVCECLLAETLKMTPKGKTDKERHSFKQVCKCT